MELRSLRCTSAISSHFSPSQVVEDTFLRQVDSLGRLTRTSLLHLGAAPFPLPASTREPGEGDGGRWGVRIGKLRRSGDPGRGSSQRVIGVYIGVL